MEPHYFDCKCCGECCSGDMRVFLNPEDLRRMAAASGFQNSRELLSRGLVIIDHGRGAPLPRIRFKTAAVKCCPFLENRFEEDGSLLGLCGLHPDSKPLVCSVAPLFREVDLDSGTESWGFKPPHPGCPGCAVPEEERYLYSEIRDEDLLLRLAGETEFFRQLSGLLGQGADEKAVMEKLYFFEV